MRRSARATHTFRLTAVYDELRELREGGQQAMDGLLGTLSDVIMLDGDLVDPLFAKNVAATPAIKITDTAANGKAGRTRRARNLCT